MTYGRQGSPSEGLGDFLDREMAERRKDAFRRKSEEKKYIVRTRKRRNLWTRFITFLFRARSD